MLPVLRHLLLNSPTPPWVHNGTWVLSGTAWTNTPTLGSELFTTGNAASDSNGNEINGTSGISASNSTLSSVADPAAGTYAVKVVSTGASGQGFSDVASSLGTWLFLSFNAKRGSQGSTQSVSASNVSVPGINVATGSYAGYVGSGRATASSPLRYRFNAGSTSGDELYFDNVSIKPLALNQLLVLRSGGAASTVTGKPTLTAGTQAGVCAKVNALLVPTDGIFCYHDGTNIKVDKLVAGTWTNLISTAVTYSAGATIEIRPGGTNIWQAWYNGSQRGTDQTISDASIVGNALYGGFSTYSGNTIDSLTVA